MSAPDLADVDRAVLAFEQEHRKHTGAKEAGIHEEFGWTSSAYYQRLNRIIDEPAALAAFPMLVKSLLRERDRKLRNRTMRVLG